ncbi:abortive phage infection protein [Kibdelosporangium persicum]|uniref:Arabinogalactan endo-beta-1,4-galactanase n=1 Tax=Kibdelosporangium persicum TaxID=2698649 RepID=A0ABX2EZT1_9PSEU|nr:abortive phage infection protein [Kibdelosporangium persicum]NRN64394.1 Arabinogalactan endo-beta-1,4-galactanase [Kibdelosporangium persicum]
MRRATFLRAAALGGLTAFGLAGEASAGQRRDAGVTYDTGTLHFPGMPLSRARWNRRLMEQELDAISCRLRCRSITVFGTDIDRQTATARAAIERGMTVYLQPRLYDHPQHEVLDHLAESARQAEKLRKHGGDVVFAAGCEHLLFTPGIIPGANFEERIATIGSIPPEEWPNVYQRLNEFLGKAADTARAQFRGTVTYGGAFFEPVDWSLFDVIGLDYYPYFATDAEYRADLAKFRTWNKPITIMEFGCCTYPGAPERGAGGYDIVDYTQDPPVIKPGFTRDEHVQAEHIARMLRIFAAEGIRAHVYTFINPEAPHAPVRERDLDISAFSLVKVIRDRYDDPYSRYRWEPKEAFHVVARHNDSVR